MVYSRDFLISIGESEGCKHLPPGVDLSLLKYGRRFASFDRVNCFLFVCGVCALIVFISVFCGTVSCRRRRRLHLRGLTRVSMRRPWEGLTGQGATLIRRVAGAPEEGGILAPRGRVTGKGTCLTVSF